jgi:DNA-binding NarL/FixJ family response regulator
MSNYTVVIADDHQIIRAALGDLLSKLSSQIAGDFRILANASNGLEALTAVKTHQPDLLFLDISMPLASGAEIIRDIRSWSPESRIIVFTGITSPGLLASIVESGVDGLFSKGEPVELMQHKIPLILQGGRFIAPELLAVIEKAQPVNTLTERERQILNKVVNGKTNKEIAKELFISPKTVDKHRSSLMSKLQVHSVAQLLAKALKEGLIDNGRDGV